MDLAAWEGGIRSRGAGQGGTQAGWLGLAWVEMVTQAGGLAPGCRKKGLLLFWEISSVWGLLGP